ncbi:MAG: ATP-grasp domain-containing protein [Gammaproteobacteria bacterium]
MNALVIVAHAARQLAAAAVATGLRPIVADFFGDEDTRELAATYLALPRSASGDLDQPAAIEVLRPYLTPSCAVVWGGGLEGYPTILRALGAETELLGCDLGSVEALTEPRTRAACLAKLRIPAPPQAYEACSDSGWLVKTSGGAGGRHVREYPPQTPLEISQYLQRWVPGRSYSLCFLASRDGAYPLGFNRHINLQPTSNAPYRYGGACVVTHLPAQVTSRCLAYANTLTHLCGWRGLCGFDFIWDDERIAVVDLNPRPPATFDLNTNAAAAFTAHAHACRGLPIEPLVLRARTNGHLVCYAPHPIRVPNSVDWPTWVADRPQRGATLQAGEPICTLYAGGAECGEVTALLRERLSVLLRSLET